ncbi:MAG TPA: GDSL-type esterase/lipase family protein [Candidatus Atribacteria bacterium]|nr:GDSL-type esterase/lipase family protein [Candidatus Atribacteria bacterium]
MEGIRDDHERIFLPTADKVRPLGRTYLHDGSLWLAYSASGAEFEFTGTKCSITFIGDNMAVKGEEKHHARIGVYVNDELVVDGLIDDAEKTYCVLDSKSKEHAVVRVIKLSETTDSTVGIRQVCTAGSDIRSTTGKDLKIEFIGDSITCGYGVEDDLTSTYSTANENAAKAYAYLTAQAMNADYSLVSISGYGVVSGYTSDGVKNETGLIMPYYDKLGMSYGRFAGHISPAALKWDFSRFVPDIIVINLGTNDSSYCGPRPERCEEFRDGYVKLLEQVREYNPGAFMVCTLGIMGASLFPYLEEAVAAYKASTRDMRVTAMRFEEQSPEDGYAVDFHPSEVTHRKAAARLTRYLQELVQSEAFNQGI